MQGDAATGKDFTRHFVISKTVSFILNHKKTFYGLSLLIVASSVNMTLEYFRPSVFKQKKKKKKFTFILTKYIHTHALCLLNIRIIFNMLLTSQHWFPAYSPSLAISSSTLNNFKSLHSHAIFSHHNLLYFFLPVYLLFSLFHVAGIRLQFLFQMYSSTYTILTNS